jgi:hypothetical protein
VVSDHLYYFILLLLFIVVVGYVHCLKLLFDRKRVTAFFSACRSLRTAERRWPTSHWVRVAALYQSLSTQSALWKDRWASALPDCQRVLPQCCRYPHRSRHLRHHRPLFACCLVQERIKRWGGYGTCREAPVPPRHRSQGCQCFETTQAEE